MTRQLYIREGKTVVHELVGEFELDEAAKCTYGKIKGGAFKELCNLQYSYDWLEIESLSHDIKTYMSIPDDEIVVIRLKSEG